MVDTKETIKIVPDISELRGLLKALSALGKEANDELKNDVQSISLWTAGEIKKAASSHPFYPAQAAIVERTVRGNRDRLPNVTIGGSKGRASGGANAGQLLYGNEFGGERNSKGNLTAFANGGFRFPIRSPSVGRGNAGYWIYPTLKDKQPELTKRWQDAVDRVFDNWKKGPGGAS